MTSKKNTNNTTGINVDKISNMKSALEDYITKVNKLVDELGATNKDIKAAMQGTNTVTTFNEYITALESHIKTFSSNLTQYGTVLESLKTGYSTNDSGNATYSDAAKTISALDGK